MADLLQSAGVPRTSPFTAAEEFELTQSYREHYDALIAQARSELGSELEQFSAKIAQHAMLSTWPRRAEFTSPSAFDDALSEAVKNEAMIQRRKHAALHHRSFGASYTPRVDTPSAEQAVAMLRSSLHEAPVDHETAVNEALDARKHHAAEHVQHVAQERGWKGPAVLIVVLGLIIVAGMRWMSSASGEVAVTKALAAEDARRVDAARGQRGSVDLSDGSVARIGSDSRMRVPASFGTTMRTVSVEGTAAFVVAPGQSLPFTVWIGDAVVTATGTAFTVRAYPSERGVVVGVDEGEVTVRGKDTRAETTVPAGQAARLLPDGTVSMLDAASKASALSWTRDSLVFDDMPVSAVLPEMGRWFDLTAGLNDAALGERRVSLRVGLQSSGDALKALAQAANLSIGFDGDDKVLLSDATVPAKTGKPR